MKLKTISLKKYKLIKYYLLKYQIYQNNTNNKVLFNVLLENIEIHFKKSLKIIYEYHIKKKKILFIGFPVNNISLLFSIIKNTSHIFISNKTWINGILSNTKYVKKHNKILSNTELKNFLFNSYQNPDLIVIFSLKNNSKIIKEINKLKIPIINFNYKKQKKENILYRVLGNYTKLLKIRLNIYTLLLYSILKIKQKRYNSYIPNILFNKFYNKNLLTFNQSKYKK